MTIVITAPYLYDIDERDDERSLWLNVGEEGIVLVQIGDSTRASFDKGIFTIPGEYCKVKEDQ